MKKSDKVELIIWETLTGLGSGLIGMLLFSSFYKFDLFVSIMYGLIAGYLSMWIGVGVVGYSFLKKIGRETYILKSLVISFFGLIAAIGFLYGLMTWFTFKSFPHFLVNLIVVALPLTGVIWGFNVSFRKD